MHRVGKSCYFFQVILILDQVQLLVCFFFLFTVPCNKPVARTSFIQHTRIEISSVCICVFLRCKTCSVVGAAAHTDSVRVPVSVRTVGQVQCEPQQRRYIGDVFRGEELTFCVCLGPVSVHSFFTFDFSGARISCRWSNWFIVWESTWIFSFKSCFGQKVLLK